MTTRKQVEETIKYAKEHHGALEEGIIVKCMREYQSTLPPDKEPCELAWEKSNIAFSSPEYAFKTGFLAGQQYEKERKG